MLRIPFVFLLLCLCLNIHAQRAGTPLLDLRDSSTYTTAWIDSTRWMTQNLRWHSPLSMPSKDSSGYRYYAFEERDQVCPAGWRLPTETEFTTLMRRLAPEAVWDTVVHSALVVGYGPQNGGLFGDPLFQLEPSGWYEGRWIRNKDTLTLWVHSDANVPADPRLHVHASDNGFLHHAHDEHVVRGKRNGKPRRFAARCVKDT